MTTAGRYLRHDGPSVVAVDFGFNDSPAPALERVFDAIYRDRMNGVPLCNHALQVEAIGFRRTGEGWLGVLVTPWFMNLMLLPARGARWTHMLLGAKRWQTFPSGAYELFGSEEAGIGEYHYFSLFSPMAGFAAQDDARSVAEAALDLLYDGSIGEKLQTVARPEEPEGKLAESEPAHDFNVGPVSASKRNFLRGRFLRRH